MIRALYGGSFDPIHAGHVAVARTLLQRGLADRVHVMPASQSPFKPNSNATTGEDRLRLVELALAQEPAVIVEDREIRRAGTSYTVDSLSRLVIEYPDDQWRLVVGADNVADFMRWRDPQRLLSLAEPVVIARGPIDLQPPLEQALVVDDFQHPATATMIRRELSAGRMPGPELLPTAVADDIIAHGLYGWSGLDPRP